MKSIDYTNDPNRFVSKQEAAVLRGVSIRTIERDVHSSRLKKYKMRGCVRFRLGDVLLLDGFPDEPIKP